MKLNALNQQKTGQAIFLFVFWAGLCGCTMVGPDYQEPTTSMPEQFLIERDPAIIPVEKVTSKWWTLFQDETLNYLIAEAKDDSLTLKTAVERVREARLRLGDVMGDRLPSLDLEGSMIQSKSSERLTPEPHTQTQYKTGFSAGWELDLFGRIGRSIESAQADYEVSKEDRVDVMITLFAEVARTYIELRTFQAQITAAQESILSQKKVLALTRSRLKHGLATELDVVQAQRVLADSESEIPPLGIEISKAINTLGFLLARQPKELYESLKNLEKIPLPPKKAAVGVPADLLRQRPDIRKAERRIASETAKIGMATAELYPLFSLKGNLGLTSLDTVDFIDSSSHFFSFGPSIQWRLFDRKRIQNQINIQDSRTKQAIYQYEQTVLQALNETENSLTAYLQHRVRMDALNRSVISSRRSLKLALGLYQEGLVDFQNVLDAQQAVFSVESRVAAARGNSAIYFVALYKALGGGWNPPSQKDKKTKSSDA